MDAQKPVAVALKQCGCRVAAMVAPGPDSTAGYIEDYLREMRRWRRRGWTLENQTVGWVRSTKAADGGLQSCTHGKRAHA